MKRFMKNNVTGTSEYPTEVIHGTPQLHYVSQDTCPMSTQKDTVRHTHYDGDTTDFDTPVAIPPVQHDTQLVAHGKGINPLVVYLLIISIILILAPSVIGLVTSISRPAAQQSTPVNQATTSQAAPAPDAKSSVPDESLRVTATPDESRNVNAHVNLSGLEGQYWSNAKEILRGRDADLTGMVILTENGKTPVVDSNWKVDSIHCLPNGRLEVRLTQITNYIGDAGDALDNAVHDMQGKIEQFAQR